MYFQNSNHALQVILPSKDLITKSHIYDSISPWLGTGLLTATGWFDIMIKQFVISTIMIGTSIHISINEHAYNIIQKHFVCRG